MVGLVPIEKDVIPMVLLVNMHLIKGTLIIFPCDLAGYRAIPMVHWYQLGKWDNVGGGVLPYLAQMGMCCSGV